EERTLARYRDRMLPGLPRRGAVVAGFDFLDRLASRDSVHSLHHVLAGRYTFSMQPYPQPRGVSALIADLSSPNLPGVATPTSALRLQELLRDNHLVPAAVSGDLVLLVRGVPDTIALVTAGTCPKPQGKPIVFDGQLSFLGGALEDTVGRPGG